MTYADIVKFVVAMIIMMNPLGSLSIFLDLTKRFTLFRQRKIALKVGLAITALMLLSIWWGSQFLDLLGITIDSFRVAGGIILLLVGLSMLQSQESPMNHTPEDDVAAEHKHSIAVVPMALPVIIGPGSISTLVIASTDYPPYGHRLWLSLLCLGLAFGMTFMLYYGSTIANIIGESVMKVITRIMGMIIMSIAVGMLARGLIGLFPVLHISAI
jgi:multiple antibiotic resistance protein